MVFAKGCEGQCVDWGEWSVWGGVLGNRGDLGLRGGLLKCVWIVWYNVVTRSASF